jgi:hypothetical protein
LWPSGNTGPGIDRTANYTWDVNLSIQ